MRWWLAALLLAAQEPFRIDVLDSQSGRGVPLVELVTVNGIRFITDSAGVIAVDELDLLGRSVFFHVSGHGYSFPKDGFGHAGLRLDLKPGGSATIKVERTNLAERLYRLTGGGRYLDTVRLGETAPICEPLLNGGVVGQDSAMVACYRGKLFWFFGDTNRLDYPLGNFAVSGATSRLPGEGGLSPDVGIDLQYFVDDKGFSKKMCPIDGQPGPVWIDGLVTISNAEGREHLIAHFARMKSLGEMYEQGFACYDDEREVFVPILRIPNDAILYARSHTIRARDSDGMEYFYFASPFPLIRVRADAESVLAIERYESYSCLTQGARFDAVNPKLERDGQNKLVYAWKRDTSVVGPREQEELIRVGAARREELLLQLHDVKSGEPVLAHAGSCYWNDYRECYVLIAQQLFDSSFAGEIWYAEAPTPLGPWRAAVKIVTHDDYSFYNPAERPWLDQEGGRFIYFDGTYSMMFSGAKFPTTRYDYNQIVYRLDLSSSKLRVEAK